MQYAGYMDFVNTVAPESYQREFRRMDSRERAAIIKDAPTGSPLLPRFLLWNSQQEELGATRQPPNADAEPDAGGKPAAGEQESEFKALPFKERESWILGMPQGSALRRQYKRWHDESAAEYERQCLRKQIERTAEVVRIADDVLKDTPCSDRAMRLAELDMRRQTTRKLVDEC